MSSYTGPPHNTIATSILYLLVIYSSYYICVVIRAKGNFDQTNKTDMGIHIVQDVRGKKEIDSVNGSSTKSLRMRSAPNCHSMLHFIAIITINITLSNFYNIFN